MSRPVMHIISATKSVTGILPETFSKEELPKSIRNAYYESSFSVLPAVGILILLYGLTGFGIWKIISSGIPKSLKMFSFQRTEDVLLLIFPLLFLILIIGITRLEIKNIQAAIQFHKGNYECAVSCLTGVEYVQTQNAPVTRYGHRYGHITTTGYKTYYRFGSVRFFADEQDGQEGDKYLLFIVNGRLTAYMNIESLLDGSYEAEQKYLREQYRLEDPEAEFVEEADRFPEYSEEGSERFQQCLIKAEDKCARGEKRKEYLYRKLNEWKMQYNENDSVYSRIANRYMDNIMENLNETEKKE